MGPYNNPVGLTVFSKNIPAVKNLITVSAVAKFALPAPDSKYKMLSV